MTQFEWAEKVSEDWYHFDMNAFASGQVGSKLWLCEELEKVCGDEEQTIWILGGWYGVSALLLRVRDRMKIRGIRSFDSDLRVEAVADRVNRFYEIQNFQFKAHSLRAEDLEYGEGANTDLYGATPNLVVATACEHFSGMDWWQKIPSGMRVALQTTNMDHEDHSQKFEKLEDFRDFMGLSELEFSGELDFNYPLPPEEGVAIREGLPKDEFKRFMLIGKK